MKERLEILIRLLKKRKFAEKIATAGNLKKAKRIFQRERNLMKAQLDGFTKDARKVLDGDDDGYVLEADDFQVTTKNVIELCWICILTGIDESEMVEEEIDDVLLKVEGPLKPMAREIRKIITNSYFFYDYSLEELLSKFV